MRCKAITSGGHPCSKTAEHGEDYCGLHNPEKIIKRTPKIKNQRIELDDPLTTIQSLRELMGLCIQQTVGLNFNPKILSSVSGACSTQMKIIELEDVVKKVQALEDMVKGDPRWHAFSEELAG